MLGIIYPLSLSLSLSLLHHLYYSIETHLYISTIEFTTVLVSLNSIRFDSIRFDSIRSKRVREIERERERERNNQRGRPPKKKKRKGTREEWNKTKDDNVGGDLQIQQTIPPPKKQSPTTTLEKFNLYLYIYIDIDRYRNLYNNRPRNI